MEFKNISYPQQQDPGGRRRFPAASLERMESVEDEWVCDSRFR
jgi:hypothetical protein